jgi:penicillin-binding protein-related factor A (putative recombinase)
MQPMLKLPFRNDGRPLEKEIETICMQYQSKGLLRMKKVEPPCRIVGRRVIFLANPFLDFIGAWTERNGRLVVFEVKSTRDATLQIGSRGLSDKQVDALRLWHAAGAVTFVLIRWEILGRVDLIPWRWIKTILDDRSHIRQEDCVKLNPGIGYVTWDFLGAMRELEDRGAWA